MFFDFKKFTKVLPFSDMRKYICIFLHFLSFYTPHIREVFFYVYGR